ncbi:trehalose utilization [Bacillus sp. UMB0899]|uniref:ThuA domain-containing protein n=1 Tax=Metabacillus schmidteae TaxID=2730405 RepID=UPI000C8041E8|nr:ThuA domain-containing protein [Metabacillus schmidteae]PMC38044.1 trehalose utilization [Bacillus sp. UMB0899]
MKKVFALIGDYYHQKENISLSLNKTIKMFQEVEVEYIKAEQLEVKLLEQPDVVVLYKANKLNPIDENVEFWMDDKLEEKVCQYVQQGGGWFVWHSGLSSYESLGKYYEMVRGKFDFHPSEHELVSYQPTGEPAIVKDHFVLLDEHYFVTCDEANTNVFLRAVSPKGNTIAGWTHAYGGGRVVCLTPAHTKEGLINIEMMNILANSLKLLGLS